MITILVGVAAFVAGYAFRGLIHKELGTIGADIKADVAKATVRFVPILLKFMVRPYPMNG